jgi:hypothetical protein
MDQGQKSKPSPHDERPESEGVGGNSRHKIGLRFDPTCVRARESSSFHGGYSNEFKIPFRGEKDRKSKIDFYSCWHLRSYYGKEVNGSYPLSRWVRTRTWLKQEPRQGLGWASCQFRLQKQ